MTTIPEPVGAPLPRFEPKDEMRHGAPWRPEWRADLRSRGLGLYLFVLDGQHLIGVKPDVQAAPTIAGLRAGRDDVLDRGIALIRGKQ